MIVNGNEQGHGKRLKARSRKVKGTASLRGKTCRKCGAPRSKKLERGLVCDACYQNERNQHDVTLRGGGGPWSHDFPGHDERMVELQARAALELPLFGGTP